MIKKFAWPFQYWVSARATELDASHRWNGRVLRRSSIVRRIVANGDGAAASEFALVVPLLLFIIFVIVQYGVLFFTYNNMGNAAREAARALAVSEVDETGAETLASNLLVAWPDGWTINAEDTASTGTPYVHVSIAVSGAEASILQFAPVPSQLQAEVFMRKE